MLYSLHGIDCVRTSVFTLLRKCITVWRLHPQIPKILYDARPMQNNVFMTTASMSSNINLCVCVCVCGVDVAIYIGK